MFCTLIDNNYEPISMQTFLKLEQSNNMIFSVFILKVKLFLRTEFILGFGKDQIENFVSSLDRKMKLRDKIR